MMTKTISRDLTWLVLASLLLATLMPMTVKAQRPNVDDGNTERPNATGADFCANLDTARAQAQTRLANQQNNLDRRSENQDQRDERLAKLEEERSSNDNRRESRYEALREHASSSDQTTAVETFITTVEDLVATRRAAIDAAIADFEDAVAELVASRRRAVDEAASDIGKDVDDVFDAAEAACDADTSGAEVRQQFIADMKALREAKAAQRDKYSFKDELEAARATRKEAMDAAQADFKSGLEAAKAELRTAFGE